MQACGEAKKAIGITEKEVRKKVDCQVVQVDLVFTRKEFEVMRCFVVFEMVLKCEALIIPWTRFFIKRLLRM